jgi:hypothetical protein
LVDIDLDLQSLQGIIKRAIDKMKHNDRQFLLLRRADEDEELFILKVGHLGRLKAAHK